MNSVLRTALAVAGLAFATQAAANITFYEREGFEGRSFTTAKQLGNFERAGFNDRASSAVVSRGERWEVCEDARFSGTCVVLRPGQYASLGAMGLNNRVSSARMVNRNARVDDNRFAPAPLVQEDYRRRGQERIYEAEVTSVRAVLGAPEQRCWVERDEFARERGSANVPATIAGAVIGGILGHQVGGGRGQDVATVGGAVAGAAIGSNVGRNGERRYGQDVQRCSTVPNQGAPEYYDVTYNFRGQEHRVQMAEAPGRTVRVNAQGEPRA